jgi:dolichol-phosphate mannosyltransferase
MIYIILPAFNEASCITSLIKKIALQLGETAYTIVVLDDGSTDGTFETVRVLTDAFPITLLKHDVNCGLGKTLKDAIAYLQPKLNDQDVVITLDADGTHEPMYMRSLIDEINKGSMIVIASRYAKGGGEIGVPIARSLFSLVANTVMQNMFPMGGVRDFTCGYRAYRGLILRKAAMHYGNFLITEDGFTSMPELLIKLLFFNLRVSEIPFLVRYDLKKGKSKMHVSKTIFRYFYLWAYLKKTQRTFAR